MGLILLMVVFPRTGTSIQSVRIPSRLRGLFQEKSMNISNLLTVDAVQVAITARQAKRELEAAIVLAETALREQAQKNRPARERRAA